MLMRIQHKKEEPEMGSRRGVLGIVFFWTQILIFFTSHSTFSQANDITASALDGRKTLDISIGGGLFPPSEPECPPPPPPEPECPPPPLPIPPKSPPPPPIPPKSPPPPPIPPKSPPPPPIPPKSPPPPPPKSPPLPPPTRPSPPPSLPPELQRAVRVIESFRKTITGDPLKITNTWRGKICSDRSAYKGFVCDTTITDNKIRVAAVNFNGFGFSGKRLQLQNFLDGLTDTIVFHVNSNNFTGDVPFGISKIPSLFEFDLSNNKLTGEFPKALLTATNLTFLDVRFNTLTGNLPPQVFTLDLDVLYLNNNFFTGKIPDNLGKTPSLYLTLANNKFTGQIPKSIGQASTLRESLLLNNQLSGCLPYQIGLLKQSTVFDVSMNHLTGPIPHSFACLQNMQYLNLSSNQLYGAVPEPVCKLRNLVSLTLNLNYFTEVGPECRKLIKNKILDVRMNCILDLPSQRSREECKAFFSKKQTCPDPGSMTYVPCKIKPASTEESREERKLVTTPRSYAALENHHLLITGP